mmetsp:Transcript_8260/g.33427  ORF Transcript_8260/g.33427 Transcript_8260/m.33427 type:complete len:253 (-) Transcript_8260:387-1145(-)
MGASTSSVSPSSSSTKVLSAIPLATCDVTASPPAEPALLLSSPRSYLSSFQREKHATPKMTTTNPRTFTGVSSSPYTPIDTIMVKTSLHTPATVTVTADVSHTSLNSAEVMMKASTAPTPTSSSVSTKLLMLEVYQLPPKADQGRSITMLATRTVTAITGMSITSEARGVVIPRSCLATIFCMSTHRAPLIALALMTSTKPPRWNCVSPATVSTTPRQIVAMMPASAQFGFSTRARKAKSSRNAGEELLHIV